MVLLLLLQHQQPFAGLPVVMHRRMHIDFVMLESCHSRKKVVTFQAPIEQFDNFDNTRTDRNSLRQAD